MFRTFPPPSFVPGPDLHSLAALLGGAVQISEFKPSDLCGMVASACQHGVAPMLYRQLQRAGIDLAAPEWQELRAARELALRRYLRFKGAFQKIHAALDAAGIENVWLKGFALAHSVYPNPALRPMRDLDVLVPYERRQDALAQILPLGYVLESSALTDAVAQMYHHYQLRGPAALELHYRLFFTHSQTLSPERFAWFWTQTTWQQIDARKFVCFKPEALLLHLSAHAILQHGEFEFILQRYLDVHLLIQKYPQLDWSAVYARALEFRWTYAVARTLEFTRDYFGTALPDGLIAELDAHRPADENTTRARWIQPDSTRFEATRTLMQAMTRREALSWVWGSLFPTPEYMRWRYPIRANWQLPFWYVWRYGSFFADALKTALKSISH